MAGSKHRGFEGFLYTQIGAGTLTKVANLTGWELDIKAAIIDSTDHDSNGWGDKLDGYRNWTFTAEHIYFDGDLTQDALLTAMLSGGVDITVNLRSVDLTTQKQFSGIARITGFKHSAKGSTAQARSLTFEGRGALSETAVP